MGYDGRSVAMKVAKWFSVKVMIVELVSKRFSTTKSIERSLYFVEVFMTFDKTWKDGSVRKTNHQL